MRTNQLTLKMAVAGDSRERALELARRMEDSRHFTQTYIEIGSTQRRQAAEIPFKSTSTGFTFPRKGVAGARPRRRQRSKAEHALMPDLRQTRKNIKIALAVLLGVDVVAAGGAVFAAGGLD